MFLCLLIFGSPLVVTLATTTLPPVCSTLLWVFAKLNLMNFIKKKQLCPCSGDVCCFVVAFKYSATKKLPNSRYNCPDIRVCLLFLGGILWQNTAAHECKAVWQLTPRRQEKLSMKTPNRTAQTFFFLVPDWTWISEHGSESKSSPIGLWIVLKPRVWYSDRRHLIFLEPEVSRWLLFSPTEVLNSFRVYFHVMRLIGYAQ